MKKKLFLLILIISNITLAQDNFRTAFKDENAPFKKNIHIELIDDENNRSSIPVAILKGNTSGPVFTIIAGVHGYEYPPIIATQELIQEINPEILKGTLIIVPIANPASFFNRSPFVNPQDKVNLNRTFPGSKTGSITEKIADMITTDIIPVTEVFLDIHGGDASEDLTPFVCFYKNEKYSEQTQQARRLAQISGFEHMVSYPYTLKDDQPAKYAFKQAVQDGKTGLSIECGKLGNVQDEAVTLIKKGVYNMLDEMKMYQSKFKLNKKPIEITKQAYIRAENKGVFSSTYKAGSSVTEGTIVGSIRDEFGKTIAEIKAPNSGIILYKIGTPPVNIGETLMCIGYGY